MKLELPSALMTGNAVIDAEHSKILSLINQCIALIDERDRREAELEETLQALIDEVRMHFRHEENIMEKMGYIGLEKHKNHHEKTLSDFDTILEIVTNKVLPPEWVIHTVIHLFISDVMVPDANIRKHMLAGGHDFPGPRAQLTVIS